MRGYALIAIGGLGLVVAILLGLLLLFRGEPESSLPPPASSGESQAVSANARAVELGIRSEFRTFAKTLRSQQVYNVRVSCIPDDANENSFRCVLSYGMKSKGSDRGEEHETYYDAECNSERCWWNET